MRSSLNQQEYQREISFSDITAILALAPILPTAILLGFAVFSRTNTRADRLGNTLPRILAVSPFISSSSHGGCRLHVVVVFAVNVRRLTASASSRRGWTREDKGWPPPFPPPPPPPFSFLLFLVVLSFVPSASAPS